MHANEHMMHAAGLIEIQDFAESIKREDFAESTVNKRVFREKVVDTEEVTIRPRVNQPKSRIKTHCNGSVSLNGNSMRRRSQ